MTDFIRHAPGRVTAPGEHHRTFMRPDVPRVVQVQPTPNVWGARIVAARVRRGASPVPVVFEDAGPLDRVFVLAPKEMR
jgi:hypothetical protein